VVRRWLAVVALFCKPARIVVANLPRRGIVTPFCHPAPDVGAIEVQLGLRLGPAKLATGPGNVPAGPAGGKWGKGPGKEPKDQRAF
jgi:hypothetical protein